jgi:hypothetical protein
MSRKFVTNPWTKIPHGHARTELMALRDLIQIKGLDCSIISETDDFGDVFVDNSDLLIELQFFTMNPLYTFLRFWNIRRYFKSTISKFNFLSEPGDDLIVSSANFEQFVIAAVFFGQQDLYIRVFSCPEKKLSKLHKNFIKFFLRSQNFRIGTETQEIANWFKDNLDLDTKIVPPLNKLRNQSIPESIIHINSQQRAIGIFYPVTSTVDIEELQKIISIFNIEDVHVKFPTEIPKKLAYENVKIIKNGISDLELNSRINSLDAVILMNHNYINRGSGLLTLCMSLGKLIYVFEDNNFVISYKERYPLISVQNSEQIAQQYNMERFWDSDKEKLKNISINFVEYVNTSWEEFLNAR